MVCCSVFVSSAGAMAPWWQLDSVSVPRNLPPGGNAKLVVSASNLGGEVEASGGMVVLRDVLPAGLVAKSVFGAVGGFPGALGFRAEPKCLVVSGSLVECTFEGSLPPYEQLEATIGVSVLQGARESGEVNEVSVSGGGAPGVTLKRPLVVSSAPTPYGVESYEMTPFGEDGSVDTQAGSHPYGLTTTLDLNRTAKEPFQPAIPKDLVFKLPPGLIGNPKPFPQCTDAQFTKLVEFVNECPANTALGVATVTIYLFGEVQPVTVPVFNLKPSPGEPALDGCNRLPFSSSISVAPDGSAGSSPSGLTVGIHVPQDALLNTTGLAESNVKDTTVALPEGVALNPAAAGLQTCSEGQVALSQDVGALCPDASKAGTVEIRTPLLPNALTGAVYLAAQNANPFGSLVALYIVAEDPVSGTLVKVAGEVKLDPVTGRIVSTFKDTPQLPFEDLSLHFFGGDRAPLGTPASCGSYTTNSSIAPWSGNEPSTSSSMFNITSGPNGGACASPLPFSSGLNAGTTSIQAGGFTPFTMTVSREDGQQSIGAIQLHMPDGLSGLLTGVELCGEAQADAGSCGPNSLIGETTVSVGLGGDPYSVTGGKVYITGPYEGAPFGLSVVVPAKAGPYDLGQVVVRGRIEVDPTTSALTVTTDTSGRFAIPHILDGIPLQIKHVNFTTTRPGFTFNPTDCNPLKVTGSISSTEGSTSVVSVPFQVTNCAILGFKPSFKVSTSGKTSRANGASLHVNLAYPKTGFGSQANIKSVKVDLPKQLPSRLETLQKACPVAVFEADPASCSSQSRIGTAKATTPLVPVPLEGPVFFVSHAGEKFPELIIVLSGYGVTVDLRSETFISKTGITSSTFRTIPDVPVGTFELTLPQGRYSALAAPTNLCNTTLKMPTAFTAQNGATIKQNTPIAVTGCLKHKKTAKKTKTKHKKK